MLAHILHAKVTWPVQARPLLQPLLCIPLLVHSQTLASQPGSFPIFSPSHYPTLTHAWALSVLLSVVTSTHPLGLLQSPDNCTHTPAFFMLQQSLFQTDLIRPRLPPT